MKRIVLIAFLSLTLLLSGCMFTKANNPEAEKETLQNLGIAYKAGNYTMDDAYCTGYITSGQTILRLVITLPKRLVEGQVFEATSVTDASLRTVDGVYVYEQGADLTKFISGSVICNDGAEVMISFTNPDKWLGSNGKTVPNNTPMNGGLKISFSITDS